MNYESIETGHYTLYLDARKNIVAYARLFDPPDYKQMYREKEIKPSETKPQEEVRQLRIMNAFLREELRRQTQGG